MEQGICEVARQTGSSHHNAVIFKLVRDKEDPKYMYLHIHQNYFDIVNNGWSKGWAEANSKTKYPSYSQYAYMLKCATLRGNEEYYTMREAKWGEHAGNDDQMHATWLGSPKEGAPSVPMEIETKQVGKKELGKKELGQRKLDLKDLGQRELYPAEAIRLNKSNLRTHPLQTRNCGANGVKSSHGNSERYRQGVCRDLCGTSSAKSKYPQKLPTNMLPLTRMVDNTEGTKRGQEDVDYGDTLSGCMGSGKSAGGLRKLGKNGKSLL